jgi:hypothetical protein
VREEVGYRVRGRGGERERRGGRERADKKRIEVESEMDIYREIWRV